MLNIERGTKKGPFGPFFYAALLTSFSAISAIS